MEVVLDQEQWEAGSQATLGDVLADISERAHARARLVTSVQLDQRRLTDRDLDAGLLAEPSHRFSRLTATSQTMDDILQSAQGTIRRYREAVWQEGARLLSGLRVGGQRLTALDAWLGQLADYLELVEGTKSASPSAKGGGELARWVQELVAARTSEDAVRMADVLEYELLPRLAA